jgi:RNA polymerase sigma factor (sigma-70 family)
MLPDRQRAAIVLRYFADLSVRDTASALGCAEGTVKSLTSQAITALRRCLVDVELEVEHA